MGECNANDLRYSESVKVLHETVARVNDKANVIAKNFVPRECARPHAKEDSKEPTDNVFDAVKKEIIELNELATTLDEIINVF